jgi:hypothetical protein
MTKPAPPQATPEQGGQKCVAFLAITERVRSEVLPGHTLPAVYAPTGVDQVPDPSVSACRSPQP